MTTRSATRYDFPPALPRRRYVTEDEFVEWCDAETWAEWVDGEIILMSPVSFQHGDIGGFLHAILRVIADETDGGVVLAEPMQVRLASQRRRRSPDIIFIAASRRSIIKPNHVEGAPDLVVEIVSPESLSRDWREKFIEYEKAGVREYWIVDPQAKRVEAYALGRDHAYKLIALRDAMIHSKALKGFALKPEWLFRGKLPKTSEVLRELGIR